MTRLRTSLLIIVCLSVGVITAMALSQDENSELDGRAVAQEYITGMETGDLEKLTALFLTTNRSSILENASDEGSWEHYRDHHLKPEMDVAKNFKFKVSKETQDTFGETVLVRQTGSFTFDIEGEKRKYRAAISYVMVVDEGSLRIAHLHWSSRPDTRAAKKSDH